MTRGSVKRQSDRFDWPGFGLDFEIVILKQSFQLGSVAVETVRGDNGGAVANEASWEVISDEPFRTGTPSGDRRRQESE